MDRPASPSLSDRATRLPKAAVGLLLLAVMSLPPILAGWRGEWALPHSSMFADLASKAAVILGLVAFVLWTAGPTRATLIALLLAAEMTRFHDIQVDSRSDALDFQSNLYTEILHLGPGPDSPCVPHRFRPLSYGFTRTLELATGDWEFACVAYRCFFQFWFLWGAYRLASLYVTPVAALAAPVVCAMFYPLSIQHYSGQLTDPMSHALFALGLVWVVQDRRGLLLGALVLGVLAKETAVVLVPAYWLCHLRKGWRTWLGSALFLAGSTATFLATRWPQGWRPGASLNGVEGTMLFAPNFDLSPYYQIEPALIERLTHPLAFLVPCLLLAVWCWRQMPWSLRALALTVPPLMIGIHVTMSWMHESRNYMPAAPVLATLFVFAAAPTQRAETRSAEKTGVPVSQ